MPTIEPLTLTLDELAQRWNMTPQQVLETPHTLPMYFYFDGLVFDFNDKWHRANGDAAVQQTLEAHKTRCRRWKSTCSARPCTSAAC
jgi:hypothetical protein